MKNVTRLTTAKLTILALERIFNPRHKRRSKGVGIQETTVIHNDYSYKLDMVESMSKTSLILYAVWGVKLGLVLIEDLSPEETLMQGIIRTLKAVNKPAWNKIPSGFVVCHVQGNEQIPKNCEQLNELCHTYRISEEQKKEITDSLG